MPEHPTPPSTPGPAKWPDDYDAETVATSGGTGVPPPAARATNEAHQMLLRRDAAWSKAIGSVIGYDADACGSVTPEHMRQMVEFFIQAQQGQKGDAMAMQTNDAVMTAAEQIRLAVVLELLRKGVSPDEAKAKAEPLVKFITSK